jgi:very-short-patch-repair endonuclease
MASGVVGVQRVTDKKLHDARDLRANMTPSETTLWARLRNRQCGGFKFRRQQIIEGFVADFFCEQAQLAIEVDGGIHENIEVKKNDAHRETVFKARGITTFRFTNDDIENSIDNVLHRIAGLCENYRKPSKLSAWEKHRSSRSCSPLASGEGPGVRSKETNRETP